MGVPVSRRTRIDAIKEMRMELSQCKALLPSIITTMIVTVTGRVIVK
jgi:hypothetical protein